MNEPSLVDDFSVLKPLLEHHHLPSHDLGLVETSSFWGIKATDYYAGIGLERYGEIGLLRSLVVDQHYRNQGLGAALVHWVEIKARQDHLTQLYLLTTTAQGFFERLGYTLISREKLPDILLGASQVHNVCPSSASVLVKNLV